MHKRCSITHGIRGVDAVWISKDWVAQGAMAGMWQHRQLSVLRDIASAVIPHSLPERDRNVGEVLVGLSDYVYQAPCL